MTDLAQHERELLVGAFLDITADGWAQWILRVGDDAIPADLHRHVIAICTGLAGGPDEYQGYLQALCLLSDTNLAWLVEQAGTSPFA